MKRISVFFLAAGIMISGNLAAATGTSPLDTATRAGAHVLELHGNLVVFNAASGKNFFELNWNVVAPNESYFIVERSYNGNHFTTLGRIGMEQGDAGGQYTYRDNIRPIVARNNDFYYRLKQVNADGSFTYSKMLIARMFNTQTLAALSVTPDPLVNDVVVNVQLKAAAYISMRVTDETGNVVLKQSEHASGGATSYTLSDTHALRPGLYTLEIVVNSKERMVMKLAKS